MYFHAVYLSFSQLDVLLQASSRRRDIPVLPGDIDSLSECCRSHGDEDLAPGQMSSIFSCSFRRCRVSLKGSVAPQGWLTHLSPLHPHVQPSEQTPDRKAASQVTLLSPDTGSVPQISETAGAITHHTQRDGLQINWNQHGEDRH